MTKNNYIINFRKRFGWSARQLAEKTGLSICSIYNWESGRTKPPLWLGFVFSSILYNLPPYQDNTKNINDK